MISLFKKTVIRVSFEALMAQLITALTNEGFTVSGITDFQQEFEANLGIHFKKYKILSVHVPYLSEQMLSFAPLEGVVLPCNITLLELHPGEIEIVPVNPTELIARNIQNAPLQNIAEEASRRLAIAIHTLERQTTGTPELFTSWE